jgi:hypothetical protein
MVKKIDLTYDDLADVLDYDGETGVFTWKKTVSSRAKAGQRAGVWLKMSNGKDYYSVTYRGRRLSAGQLAWFLTHGEWPDRAVFFIDEDPTNLRISNLKLADHKAIRFVRDDGTVGYRMSIQQIRHYGLGRYYGLTLTQYAEMYARQGGVCAICKRPETHKVPGRKKSGNEGRVRDLSVDHCHGSGAVRELLCNDCNHMLGSAKDNPETLRAAADYIERHKKD